MLTWRFGRFRLTQLRRLWSYPPTYIAVVLAWCFALAVFFFCELVYDAETLPLPVPPGWAVPLWWGTVGGIVLLIGASAHLAMRERGTAANKLMSEPQRKDLAQMPFEEIVQWVNNEMPINDPTKDYLMAAIRATRVWEAIQTPRPNRDGRDLRNTVVIQGPFGSGKSSLLNLVQREARNSADRSYIFARISCWGFSSLAAPQHILEQAIKDLSSQVDCLGLRNLPVSYIEALKAGSPWLQAAAHVLSVPQSAVEQLKRFTPILKAINAQLVILLEDADRAGSDFDEKDIEAMLNNIRDVERLSFVFTVGDRSGIEFPRVAENIEFLPRIPIETVLDFLDKVRDDCRSKYGDIDPSPKRQESLRADADEDTKIPAAMLGVDVERWGLALGTLLKTPRQLKCVLRDIMLSWKTLHGEVDLDDLIMVTTLRHAAPGAFTFIGTNFSRLRELRPKEKQGPNSALNDKNAEEILERLKKRWQGVAEASEHNPEDLTTILNELLPQTIRITGNRYWEQHNRAQSVRRNRGEEYWQRLSTQALEPCIVRDQEVLRALRAASNDKGAAHLGEAIASSADFGKRLVFLNGYSPQLGANVAQAAASALLRSSSINRGFGLRKTASWYYSTRWMDNYIKRDASWVPWFENEIAKCFPECLQLAIELFDLAKDRLGIEEEARLRKTLVESARASYENIDAPRFAECFNRDFPYTLGYLLWIYRKKYRPELLTQPGDWTWIAPALLRGLASKPDVFVPQVMCAFGESGPGGEPPKWFNFNADAVNVVFGAESNLFYRLLSQPCDISRNLDASFSLAIPLARKQAETLSAKQTT
ncbi:MAG: P-loop NTPase fold protein [Verrucomicrobia bacterium]|nr:P-loop NTPase fold protein [Verrucomicrobiota bacterium]